MLDLDDLTKRAAEAATMPASFLLARQCRDLARYARRTKWHFAARKEAELIAQQFDAVMNRCIETADV